MSLRALVCWPACPSRMNLKIRFAARKAFVVDASDESLFASLYIQVHPLEFKKDGDAAFAKKVQDARKGAVQEAVCFLLPASEVPAPVPAHAKVLTGAHARLVALAFEHPLRAFEALDGRSKEVLLPVVDLSEKLLFRPGAFPDVAAYGDAALACYGIRKPRDGRMTLVISGPRVRDPTVTTIQEYLSSALHVYHGVDLRGEGYGYFMGFLVPSLETCFAVSRARSGGEDRDVQVMDSLALKSMGVQTKTHCVFSPGLSKESWAGLLYPPARSAALASYLEECAALAKTCGQRDFGYDLRAPGNAKSEMRRADELQRALGVAPVLPRFYGVLECGGRQMLAVEQFESTLAELLGGNALADVDLLEILARVAWCVGKLTDANMRHTDLEPGNVLLRKSVPSRPAPLLRRMISGVAYEIGRNEWDVRLFGPMQVAEAAKKQAPGSLVRFAKGMLSGRRLLRDDEMASDATLTRALLARATTAEKSVASVA